MEIICHCQFTSGTKLVSEKSFLSIFRASIAPFQAFSLIETLPAHGFRPHKLLVFLAEMENNAKAGHSVHKLRDNVAGF